MRSIQDWIRDEAQVVGPEFVRVDGILNHRVVPAFIDRVGEGLAAAFADAGATCVVTAEAAGNIVAYEVARRLRIPALYAKKGTAATMARPLTRWVTSPTKGTPTLLSLSSDFISEQDRVLIVDDFLYQGATSAALAEMIVERGAALAGFGFVIEKTFAAGRERLDAFGVPIVSLARIRALHPDTGVVEFVSPEEGG